jgi:hypothetical protein
MIECPFCFRVFRQPPEKLGARCPKCRMPLYEDPARRKKGAEKDYGACLQHPEAASVAKCSRCDAPVCQSCRTRWHDEVVCPRCIDNSLVDDEPSPQEAQMQTKQAWFGVIAAIVGWMLLLMTCAPLSTFHQGAVQPTVRFATFFLFLVSFLPTVFGLGFAIAAVRLRGGSHNTLATCGLVSAGSHLGLTLGLIALNLWNN